MSTTSDISPDFPYESKFIAYSEKLKKSPIPKLLIYFGGCPGRC